MTFPWKKVKNTKISQLVSDHLESQRRQRGHLVVETGFPTSLVDLFVKNRDRLKKPKSSKKKKKAQNIDNPPPLPTSSPFTVPQGPWPSPLSTPSVSRSPSSVSLSLTPAVSSSLPAFSHGLPESHRVYEEKKDEGPDAKGVIGAILRIFLVVVLALGAKKFAVGFTVSTFLLFLGEYLRKYSYRLLFPCSVAKRRLRLLMQRIFQVINFRSLEENNRTVPGIKGQLRATPEFNNHGGSAPNCEIQIARPMFVAHVQDVREVFGESSSDTGKGVEIEKEIARPSCDGISEFETSNSKIILVEEKEMCCGRDNFESNKEKSKRGRLKAKMKRLVPRKLRGSKREKRDLEGETSSIGGEIVAVVEKPEENEQEDVRSLETGSKLSSTLSRIQEENDEINMICSYGVVGQENLEEAVSSREEQGKQRKGNSGYLILCLIVLIGLVGGRIIAFLFMVLWFLMLKSGERLRRCLKWPVIRALTEKSC